MRKVNQNCLKLIKSSEGCELKAYPDPASPQGKESVKHPNQRAKNWNQLPGDPWTIGYGATGLDYYNVDASGKPKPIGPGTTWTQDQADTRLEKDVNEFARGVEALLKVNVTDNQFAALVCFAYNVGLSNLKKSTLLSLVHQKRFQEAADEFLKWDKAQGKVLKGLTIRRENERRLFLTP